MERRWRSEERKKRAGLCEKVKSGGILAACQLLPHTTTHEVFELRMSRCKNRIISQNTPEMIKQAATNYSHGCSDRRRDCFLTSLSPCVCV